MTQDLLMFGVHQGNFGLVWDLVAVTWSRRGGGQGWWYGLEGDSSAPYSSWLNLISHLSKWVKDLCDMLKIRPLTLFMIKVSLGCLPIWLHLFSIAWPWRGRHYGTSQGLELWPGRHAMRSQKYWIFLISARVNNFKYCVIFFHLLHPMDKPSKSCSIQSEDNEASANSVNLLT